MEIYLKLKVTVDTSHTKLTTNIEHSFEIDPTQFWDAKQLHYAVRKQMRKLNSMTDDVSFAVFRDWENISYVDASGDLQRINYSYHQDRSNSKWGEVSVRYSEDEITRIKVGTKLTEVMETM